MRQDDEQGKRISRRGFMKGAGTLGATVAATGVFGGPFVSASATAEAAVPQKWDAEADVVVIGTGVAGYGAAIEAKDAGAEVILIEKENWYGGNAILAGGNMQFPANHIQKAAGIEDRPEWAFEDIMEMGEHRNSPERVRLFVENAADTALWLEKLGIVWSKGVSKQEGCRVARTLVPSRNRNYPLARGISEIVVLHKAAEARKIQIKLGMRMTRILRADSQGPVLGIEALANGKAIHIKAKKAVILATGGFKANHQMIRALDPRLDEPFPWSGHPYTNTVGEGHFAAAAVGAGFVDMSFVCEFSFTIGSSRYVVWDPPALDAPIVSGGLPFGPKGKPYMILVDNEGKRYVNEGAFSTGHVIWKGEHTAAYLNLPNRPRKAWMVVDAEGAKALAWTAGDFQSADPKKAPYLDPKLVATAGTLNELAGKMELSGANLSSTVAKFNGFAAANMDGDFRRPGPLQALKAAPFFAARIILNTHDQCGGIRVNSRMQVIDQNLQAESGGGASLPLDEERVIPRLYAVGECTGGLYGADRGAGKMGSYLVEGRFAGKNAATEKPM
jgi:flavocytochrome c